MKCPNPLKVETAPDGFRYISVGETGRGRKLTKVPVGGGFPVDVGALRAADVRPAPSGRGVGLHPEGDPADERALVHIQNQSGFRGSWTLFCGVLAPPPADHPRPSEEDPGGLRASRQRMIKRDYPTPTPAADPRRGPVWFPAGTGRVAVIAEGRRAQGAAGAMGGGPEYLVVLEPGAVLTVHRTGRLYGNPSRLIVKWDGDRLTETPWGDYPPAAAGDGEGEAW